jgi:hypothetical protein
MTGFTTALATGLADAFGADGLATAVGLTTTCGLTASGVTSATRGIGRVLVGAETVVTVGGIAAALTVALDAGSGRDDEAGTAPDAATATLAVAARLRTMRATNNGRAQAVVERTGRCIDGSSR